MMISLHQFPRSPGIPNLSPFCLKLETYLRLARVPHVCLHSFDTARAPKKKMPYVMIDGEPMGDSQLIIDHLSALRPEWDLDRDLKAEQKAVAVAVTRMVEEGLIRIGVHLRWVDDEGWSDFEPWAFGKLPRMMRFFVAKIIRPRHRRRSWNDGTGRHTREELLAIADRDLRSVDELLGDREYFFGDKPHLIDCVLFGSLAQFILVEQPKALTEKARAYPRLLAYVRRMHEAFERFQT